MTVAQIAPANGTTSPAIQRRIVSAFPPKPTAVANWEFVTPEIAGSWESLFAPNRSIRQHKVRAMVRDLQRGAWAENGETVKFDEDGFLIDGEHRLRAISQAGVPVWLLVVRGVKRSTRHTVDTGTARIAADALRLDGEKNTNVLAAAVAWLIRWQNGSMLSTTHITHDEIKAALAADLGIRDSLSLVDSSQLRVLCPTAPLVFIHYVASTDNRPAADDFVHMIATGTYPDGRGLDADHAVLRLRDRLIKSKSQKEKLPTVEIVALTIKAWNLTRTGRRVKSLVWRGRGPSAEAFPEFEFKKASTA